MKQSLYFAIMVASATCIGFNSCSEIEEEFNYEEANASIVQVNGKRLIMVGDFVYGYNGKNELASICYNNHTMTKDDDQNTNFSQKIMMMNNGSSSLQQTLGYTRKGYISKTSYVYTEENSSGKEYRNGWTTLDYNSFDQVISFAYESKDEWTYGDGSVSTQIAQGRIDVSYDGEKMVSAVHSYSITENDETESGSITYVFSYENALENQFYQYSPEVVSILFNKDYGFVEPLSYVGLLGKASSHLPSSVSLSNTRGKMEEGTKACSYKMNEDGTINTADNNRYHY